MRRLRWGTPANHHPLSPPSRVSAAAGSKAPRPPGPPETTHPPPLGRGASAWKCPLLSLSLAPMPKATRGRRAGRGPGRIPAGRRGAGVYDGIAPSPVSGPAPHNALGLPPPPRRPHHKAFAPFPSRTPTGPSPEARLSGAQTAKDTPGAPRPAVRRPQPVRARDEPSGDPGPPAGARGHATPATHVKAPGVPAPSPSVPKSPSTHLRGAGRRRRGRHPASLRFERRGDRRAPATSAGRPSRSEPRCPPRTGRRPRQ